MHVQMCKAYLAHKHKHITIHRAFSLLLCARSLCKITTTGLLTVRNSTMTTQIADMNHPFCLGALWINQCAGWVAAYRNLTTTQVITIHNTEQQCLGAILLHDIKL